MRGNVIPILVTPLKCLLFTFTPPQYKLKILSGIQAPTGKIIQGRNYVEAEKAVVISLFWPLRE